MAKDKTDENVASDNEAASNLAATIATKPETLNLEISVNKRTITIMNIPMHMNTTELQAAIVALFSNSDAGEYEMDGGLKVVVTE